jgi:hypothetical protein
MSMYRRVPPFRAGNVTQSHRSLAKQPGLGQSVAHAAHSLGLLHKILAVAHFVAQNAAKPGQNTPF